jgi:hypothetical protein
VTHRPTVREGSGKKTARLVPEGSSARARHIAGTRCDVARLASDEKGFWGRGWRREAEHGRLATAW